MRPFLILTSITLFLQLNLSAKNYLEMVPKHFGQLTISNISENDPITFVNDAEQEDFTVALNGAILFSDSTFNVGDTLFEYTANTADTKIEIYNGSNVLIEYLLDFAPYIIYSDPTDEATGVALDQKITIALSKPIADNYKLGSTLYAGPKCSAGLHNFQWVWNQTMDTVVVELSENSFLEYGSKNILSIAVLDTNYDYEQGDLRAFSSAGGFSFWCKENSGPDFIFPSTESILPENATNDVSIYQPIVLTFNEPIGKFAIQVSTEIGNSASTPFPDDTTHLWNSDRTELIIDHSGFEENAYYEFRINYKDSHSLCTREFFSFTTGTGEEIDKNPPVINRQVFNIDENVPKNTFVGKVIATDMEAAITYRINNGNVENAFRIDSAFGEIFVLNAAAIDYETNPSFSLTVEADDGTHISEASVTITLNNLDEHPTSIRERSMPTFSAQPNPCSIDQVKIDAPYKEVSSIKVFNGIGKLVERYNVYAFPKFIYVRDYPKGLYYIAVENSEGIGIQKVIIQ